MESVLITGGTSGIGYGLARIYAKNRYHVILVSSNEERLKATQEKLSRELSTDITVYTQDLPQLGAAKKLYGKIQADGIQVDILINNAGFGLVGRTEEVPLHSDKKMMILNVISLVELCKLFLPTMYERGHGKILNVASTGAFQPGPYTSTYYASKAFVLSYSRAIRYEANKKWVEVCVACPGATKTNFFNSEGVETPILAMSADSVAAKIYSQLMHNKAILIPGFRNKLMNLLPTPIKMAYVAKMKGGN